MEKTTVRCIPHSQKICLRRKTYNHILIYSHFEVNWDLIADASCAWMVAMKSCFCFAPCCMYWCLVCVLRLACFRGVAGRENEVQSIARGDGGLLPGVTGHVSRHPHMTHPQVLTPYTYYWYLIHCSSNSQQQHLYATPVHIYHQPIAITNLLYYSEFRKQHKVYPTLSKI